MKDKNKALKKWHAKLKAEFDGKKEEKKSSDDELKEPKTDEDYSDKEKEGDKGTLGVTTTSAPVRKTRVKRGRRPLTYGRGKKARAREPVIIEPTDPELHPIAAFQLEHQNLIYQLGDIVKVEGEEEEEENKSLFYQIRGFYRDQFCGRYAGLQDLALVDPKDNLKPGLDPIDPGMFVQGQPRLDPVELQKLHFVLRIPPGLTLESSHDQKVMWEKEGAKKYINGVSQTISNSGERPDFQFTIY